MAVITIASSTLYDPVAVAVVNDATVGKAVSITKSGSVKLAGFPAASVTVIVLPEYVPAANVLNVTVLSPLDAESLVENAKLLVIVPASPVLNT